MAFDYVGSMPTFRAQKTMHTRFAPHYRHGRVIIDNQQYRIKSLSDMLLALHIL